MPGPYFPQSGEPPYVRAIMDVLQKWLEGMESGEAFSWHPDPDYTFRNEGNPEEKVAGVFQAIEDRFALEVPRVVKHDGGLAEKGPEFERLPFPQRLAMVQEIDAALKKVAEPPPKTEEEYSEYYPHG